MSDAQYEVENLVKLLKIRKDYRILDLCCGIGRHSLAFSQKGFKVTGVDRTPDYNQKAKRAADEKDADIDFIIADMREYCQTGAFDIIIDMFGSFGYFEDESDDKRFISNMYKSLRAGGRFLIETMGKEIMARIYREKNWSEEGDMLVLQQRKPNRDWSCIYNRWIIIKGTQRTELTLSVHLYSAKELSNLFYDIGFSKVDILGNLDGSEYDPNAERLVITGYK